MNYKNSFILGAFGLICLFTAMIMSVNTGERLTKQLPAEGGRLGPIIIQEDNEVVNIVLKQSLGMMKWSAVEVSVLDEQGNYLFAFGDEFWHESGYSSDGYWEEAKDDYSLSVTFPEEGKYFLDVSAKGNTPKRKASPIYISVERELGSSIALLWLGFGALGIAVFMFYLKAQREQGGHIK